MFVDLPDRETFVDFVRKTYRRNGLKSPNITGIAFGETYNTIELDDGMVLYHGISCADKKNDEEITFRELAKYDWGA